MDDKNIKITVTDEMVEQGAAEARAWGVRSSHGGWSDEETQRNCTRDILEAAAPLIAAQALRDAAGSPIPRGALARETRSWLRALAEQIEAREVGS